MVWTSAIVWQVRRRFSRSSISLWLEHFIRVSVVILQSWMLVLKVEWWMMEPPPIYQNWFRFFLYRRRRFTTRILRLSSPHATGPPDLGYLDWPFKRSMVFVLQSVIVRYRVHIIDIPELRSIARLRLCLWSSFAINTSEFADLDVFVLDITFLPCCISGMLGRTEISQRCHRAWHLCHSTLLLYEFGV